MLEHYQKRDEKGFTLIELLVAIVVVAILAAVAIVGISGLTDKGQGSACGASVDAAKAAAAVHYANTGSWPSTFDAMTGTPKELDTATGVSASGTTMTGKGWSVTLVPPSGSAPTTFTACP